MQMMPMGCKTFEHGNDSSPLRGAGTRQCVYGSVIALAGPQAGSRREHFQILRCARNTVDTVLEESGSEKTTHRVLSF